MRGNVAFDLILTKKKKKKKQCTHYMEKLKRKGALLFFNFMLN